jgi:dolichol kinase
VCSAEGLRGLLCALIAAAAATLVELFGPDRWFCDDNVTIPIATGAAFTLAFTLIGNGGIPPDFA